jgi:predicted regulator of Ras-like GTPase activity (Roadblock/LC7/MglB family)
MPEPQSIGDQRLHGPLEALSEAPGVKGALVATEDGLPLAILIQGTEDSDALAAAAAALGRAARRALEGMGRGELELAVIDTSKLQLIICGLSIGILLVIASPGTDLEELSPEISRAAHELERAAGALVGT